MCGNAEPALALDIIRLALKPASCCVQSIPRGLAEPAIASASPPADPQSRIK
jgi:S-adenosylmethionine/arginine decarboxylase-like enzyme